MPRYTDLELQDFAPDREWRIVGDLVTRGKLPSRKPCDALRRQACRFLKRWDRATPVDVEKLKREYPDIFVAYCLWANQRSAKWAIEAGILTPTPFGEIGAYLGYAESVITTYEKLFFQVRDRIGTRGYVHNMIIMPAISQGMHGRDFDYLYKVLSFCAGWKVFIDFLEVGEMGAETENWLQSSFRSRLKKLGWMAVHRLEVNQYSALEIVDKCIELQRLEREHNIGSAQDQASELMKDLLEGNSLTIIPAAQSLPADERRALAAPADGYTGPYAIPQEVEHATGKAQ